MKKPDIFDLLADLPQKEIDPDAFSVSELAAAQKYTPCHMRILAMKKVAAGDWEQVWKQGTRFLVPAYRLKRQPTRKKSR